jgi:hypothetical protein
MIAEVGTIRDRHWLHVEEAAAPASPDVVEALEAAEFALNITVAAESDDRSWYDEACEALETVRAALAALPAAPAGLDDLLHRVDEAIGGAPGMYVAGYGGSMIGRDHAVRVVSDALRAAYAEGASR